MAIVNKGMGWGPMRARRIGRAGVLSPAPDPRAVEPEAAEAAANEGWTRKPRAVSSGARQNGRGRAAADERDPFVTTG